MFNRTKINALVGLVGYKTPANPSYDLISTANQASRSGRYFTDNHYCKIEYIKDCQDFKDINQSKFNELLDKIQKTAIINVCDQVFDNDDLLEREVLYPYAQNKQNIETLPAGFIGYRIRKQANVAFKIERVLCEFANTGTFTLYLFSSNQPTPLFSQAITVTTVGYQWVTPTVNWTVDNTTNYEGEYYLGYIKGALQTYKHDYQASNVMAYFNNLCIDKIYVSGHATGTLFDLNDIDGLSENIGINPDIVVYNDHTDWILRNEMLFAPAICTAGQIDVIKLITASFRSNFNERVTKEMRDKMLFEIEGNPELKIYGLKGQYDREIKKLKGSFRQKNGIILHTLE